MTETPRTNYAAARLRDIGDRPVHAFPRWTNRDLANFSLLLNDAEAAQDAARQRDVAEDVAKAIGGFLWLANNLHNVDSPQFVGMFRAAAEDARPIYEKYAALLRATEGKPEPRHTEGQGEVCDPSCPHWDWAILRATEGKQP